MYRIGICDDDKELCSRLEEQIYHIAKELSVKAEVEVWYSGEGILNDLGNGTQLDLIFLDIELVHKNGISVGKFIRGEMEDIQTHIVYISSKQSYAMQLFKTQPLDFLIKPVSNEQLKEVLGRSLKQKRSPEICFEYQKGSSIRRIPTKDIAYLMSMDKKIRFAFGQEYAMHLQAIQTLLLLICVTIISHISYPADSREIAFDKRQAFILIVIPATSVFVLCVLLYERFEGTEALLICVSTLIINLSVFYLYHMMAENYKNIRDNDIYRQQTYAYQNQLDVIMESQSRIKALKHDMKNHILAMQMLLQKKDWEEADRYLSSMQGFMANPSEYISTGNDTMDSLLNYKLQRANDVLNAVETRINIPERLILHSFDLNVVLGNLLDNAIEAAGRTEEKKLKIAIKLDKGILFINVRNSCHGIADGKIQRMETTKEDVPNHGMGLRNVRRIVEKYNGDMDLICEDGIFEADIMMYVKEM